MHKGRITYIKNRKSKRFQDNLQSSTSKMVNSRIIKEKNKFLIILKAEEEGQGKTDNSIFELDKFQKLNL